LTDPSRSGTASIDEGKGALGQAAALCRLPLVAPEEWVQTREGKSLLDKNDLLMEGAETQSFSIFRVESTFNIHTLSPNKFSCIFRQMRVVVAKSSRSPVYPVGEGAAPSPRCSRRQPCRAYPGGFNPDQHGSTFQAEPLAAALNTGYCLLPNRGIGIAIPRAV